MNVLITNDDGIESEGIRVLAEALSAENRVLVVAPDSNRSACGHSLSIEKPIILRKYEKMNGVEAYALFAGTPADCVRFALMHMRFQADVVVAGVNKGSNIGCDVIYSGTVAGALEGVVLGVPSIAVSSNAYGNNDYGVCADFVSERLNGLVKDNDGSFAWNINVPNLPREEIQGFRYTPLGKQIYSECYHETKNIDGEIEYRLSGAAADHDDNDSDCDVEWLKKGYITITPVHIRLTDDSVLGRMR